MRRLFGPFRRFFKVLGPGFITGASDDDPSGIGTYATAGASLGFAVLWTAWLTFPLMAAIQLICARIGMVSGMGLSRVLRKYYPRALLYPVVLALLIANTINAGTDMGAVAAAINLLIPIPTHVLILPVGLLMVAFQLWVSYRVIARVFRWLTLTLFAYIGAALLSRPDLGDVLRGTFVVTLRCDPEFLLTLVAILGTTISPYLFFWQAAQEVEEEIGMGRRHLRQRKGATRDELRWAAKDVDIGMLFSNIVMYFVILATAATLFRSGRTDIHSAIEAAEALRPLAGDGARLLFALGLIGAGFLAVPILTGSAGYAMAEALGWPSSLDERVRRAKGFYAVIAAATALGMLVNFLGINPIDALFWTAVINGFLAPPLLVVIMHIANNSRVMGPRVNTRSLNILGWATAVIMSAAAGALAWRWLR